MYEDNYVFCQVQVERISVKNFSNNLAAPDFALLRMKGLKCTKFDSTNVKRFACSTSSSCMRRFGFVLQICTTFIKAVLPILKSVYC